MSTTESTTSEVLRITERALQQILELRDQEDEGGALGLRIEVTGNNGVDFTYDLAFASEDEIVEGDTVEHSGDLRVIVPAASVDKLRGSTLDLPSSPGQGGLVLRNPNRPDPLGDIDLELTGEPAEKVTQLLEKAVNPALAAHGGYATLERVEGDTAYVIMGGGCQGCGLAQLTLTEGIKAQIENRIPEIREVVDVTDHASGLNPFYEATAK